MTAAGAAWIALGVVLAQASGPRFPSEVELVTLDAVAVDSRGRPVSELGRDEFVLKEDGVVQEIVRFERFGGAPDAPPPASVPPEAAPSRGGPLPPETAFALVVDDQGMGTSETAETRRSLERLVTGAFRDGDNVVLATTSGDAWWTATIPGGREDLLAILRRIRGRAPEAARAFDHISDYEAFAIRDRGENALVDRIVRRWTATGACIEMAGREDPGCPARVRAAAAAVDGARRQRAQGLLATLRRTVDALGLGRGRKSVVLFSRGFLQDSDTSARDLAAAARRANAAVYFIDARGLQTGPGQLAASDAGPASPSDLGRIGFESGVMESGGTQALAEETGGFSVRNRNDLEAAADQVASESRNYYLLGFHPRAGGKPTDWRKLTVDVTRPGVTVRTRKGYTLRAEAGERAGKRSGPGAASAKPPGVVAAALDSARNLDGIPLRATAFVFEPRPKDLTRVLVLAEFDAGDLRFEGVGGARTARLAFGVAVTDRDTGRMRESHERVEVRAGEADGAGRRSLAREFDLPAGVFQARVVLHEPGGGALAAVSHRFEVFRPDVLRLTTPIVTDRVERGKGGDEHPRAAIGIERVFRPRGAVYCEFEVLGARTDPARGAPRVAAGVEVRTADGRTVRKAEATPIAPDARGRLLRLVGIGVDGLPEGSYRLVLDVRDDVSGARIEKQEAFALRAGPD